MYQLGGDQVGELMNLIEVMGAVVGDLIVVMVVMGEEVEGLTVLHPGVGEEVEALMAAIVIVVMEVGAEEQLFGPALVEEVEAHSAEDLEEVEDLEQVEDLAEDRFLKGPSLHEKEEVVAGHLLKPAVAAVVEGHPSAMGP